MAEIEWKIPEQMLSQELVSTDNRWHISKTQSGHGITGSALSRSSPTATITSGKSPRSVTRHGCTWRSC